ncbi:hypothetical protein HK104_008142, partial [Borealophlyctis nickersoniae]
MDHHHQQHRSSSSSASSTPSAPAAPPNPDDPHSVAATAATETATTDQQTEDAIDDPTAGPTAKKPKISAKRAHQNRTAQRAFRLRKEEYVRSLELRTRTLEDQVSGLSDVGDQYREQVRRLDGEKGMLRGQLDEAREHLGELRRGIGVLETENWRLRG